MKTALLAAAVGSALLLAGCASPLANKSPDMAVRYVLKQNMAQSQYNFTGVMGFDQLLIKKGEATTNPELADITNEVARSLFIDFNGAIDLPGKQLEITPRLRFERRNIKGEVSVPLKLDLQKNAVLVDPAAIDLISKELRDHPGRFVRFALPKEFADKIPTDAIIKGLPEVLDQAYAQADKQAFTLEPLDDTARQLGASYQLRVALSQEQQSQLTLRMIDGLARIVRDEAERRGKPEEAQQAMAIAQVIKSLSNNEQKGFFSESTVHLYADRSARLIGLRERIDLSTPEFDARAYATMKMSNFGKPVFAYPLTEAQIIDFDKLPKPAWLNSVDKPESAEE